MPDQNQVVIPSGNQGPISGGPATQEMSMRASAACSTSSGYLVFNTQTEGWKVFPSEIKAKAISRSQPHYRLFPVWERGVDSKFINFVKWAVS